MKKTETQEYREQYIGIDPSDLHNEWLNHPTTYDKAAQAVSDHEIMKNAALEDVDFAKESLERTKAKLWVEIKQNFKDYGFEKNPTKEDIENTVIKVKRYEIEADDLLRAKKHLNSMNEWLAEAKSLVKSLDIKKIALEELVKLWIGGYYSVPQINEPLKSGKRFSDLVYERCENKQRERLRMSTNKREQQKEKCMCDLEDKGVKKTAEKALEKEDKKDNETRIKTGRRIIRRNRNG